MRFYFIFLTDLHDLHLTSNEEYLSPCTHGVGFTMFELLITNLRTHSLIFSIIIINTIAFTSLEKKSKFQSISPCKQETTTTLLVTLVFLVSCPRSTSGLRKHDISCSGLRNKLPGLRVTIEKFAVQGDMLPAEAIDVLGTVAAKLR